MAKTKFVDFKAVKAAITMEQLLRHYGIIDQFKRTGDSLNGPCPIHKGSNPTQFRVSTTKNLWNCFSDCEHDHGYRKVVALMGSTLSSAQEELIRQHTTSHSHVIVMLDENDAGKAGREDSACRLSKFCFVRVYQFSQPDMEPEHLTAEAVRQLMEGVL